VSSELAARAAMGTSLAFHMIFAALGVGLPVLLCLAEGLGLRRREAEWYLLARRWGKAFGILFVIGAVSGTTLSFELGLLWPRFMGFASGVIGLPFVLEGFAFFLEAIFLGLYLYGWDRLSPRAHWLCTIPLVVSGAASAWFVVTANAWMQTPTGYHAVNGKVTSVNPIAAMFNPSTPTQTLHTLLACYQVAGFAVAAIYAWALLRGDNSSYNKRGLKLGMLLGTVVAPVQAVVGDLSAEVVARTQPTKLAAMEALFRTTKDAPLTILGFPNPNTGKTLFAIQIPDLLSLLAYHDPNATVAGLDAFPREYWPPVVAVHLAFDLMVGAGVLMILLPAWFWLLYWRRGHVIPSGRPLLWAAVVTGVLGFVAMEAGWMVTELGRQPWIIYNVMLVRDGVTPVPGLGLSFFVFTTIYALLAVALVGLLLRLAREPHALPAAGELEAAHA
jgi:cytochrome d ubiquinol oxidase subunit I